MPNIHFVTPNKRHDRYGVVSRKASNGAIPHTTIVPRNLAGGMKRAHASAKPAPPLAPRTLKREMARESARARTSEGHSAMLRLLKLERPIPGRSRAMRRVLRRVQSAFQERPQMRDPGMPWKRKITGEEGWLEP
jgi:hypothetical protein